MRLCQARQHPQRFDIGLDQDLRFQAQLDLGEVPAGAIASRAE
jgi:hypothetical protein